MPSSRQYDPYPFTTLHVLELFGLNYQRFRKWIERDIIIPDKRSPAAGKTHRFSRENLYAIGTFLKLIKFGVSPKNASEFIYYFDWKDWSDFSYDPAGFYIIVIEYFTETKKKQFEGKIKILPYRGGVPDLKKLKEQRDFGFVYVIDVQKITKFIDSELE